MTAFKLLAASILGLLILHGIAPGVERVEQRANTGHGLTFSLAPAVSEVPHTSHPMLKLLAIMFTGGSIVVLFAVFIRSQCRPVPENEDDVTMNKRSC